MAKKKPDTAAAAAEKLAKLLGPSLGKAAALGSTGAKGALAAKNAGRKQFRTTVNAVIIDFEAGALKKLHGVLRGLISKATPGKAAAGAEPKQPSWWKKIIGPALLILGGLAAFVYGLITDGPLKGLMKLLAQGGILGGIKWMGSVIGKQIDKIKGFFRGFVKILPKGFQELIETVKGKVLKFFDPVMKIFKETIPNFFKKMFAPVSKLFKAGGSGGILSKIMGFIGKWGGKILSKIKFIPVLGGLISFAFAYSRFKKGDVAGGVLEIISGIAGFFPGVGTAISIGVSILLAVLDAKAGGSDVAGGKAKPKGEILKEWGKKIFGFILKVPPFAQIVGFAKGIMTIAKGGGIMAGLMDMAYAIPFFGTVAGWLGAPSSAEEAKEDLGNKEGFFASIKNYIMDMFPIKNLLQFGGGIGKVFSGDFVGGLTDMAYAVPFFGSLVSFFGGPASKEEAVEQISKQGGRGFFKSFKDGALRKVLGYLPESVLGVSIRSRVAKMLGIDMTAPVQKQEQLAEKSIDQGSKSISDAGKKIAEASGKFGKSSPGVWEYLAKASKSMSSNIFRIISAGRTFISTIYQGLLKITKEMAKKFKQMSQPGLAERAGSFLGNQFRGMIPKLKTPMPTESWVRGPMPQTLIKPGQPIPVRVVEPVQMQSSGDDNGQATDMLGYSRTLNEKLFPNLLKVLGEEGPIYTKLTEINSSIKRNAPIPGGGGGGAPPIDIRGLHQPL